MGMLERVSGGRMFFLRPTSSDKGTDAETGNLSSGTSLFIIYNNLLLFIYYYIFIYLFIIYIYLYLYILLLLYIYLLFIIYYYLFIFYSTSILF